MSLGELPAVILDVIVACAGEEHGWRLEVVSSSLQATSMECAAVRLGKCRWMGGNRGMAEFRPSWRHVAVALRRCPYYLLRPGGGPKHLRFFYPHGEHTIVDIRPNACFVSRRQADTFAIQPNSQWGGDYGNICDHPSRGYPTGRYQAFLTYQMYNNTSVLIMTPNHLLEASTPWLLHLSSHASHLPFRRCRNEDGSIPHVLKVHYEPENGAIHQVHQVPHWELAPATLADDERFEWRV
ncbi:unnamed protein product [Pelagomonas calceolata]|uniref:Uncharacterized protein n=1 Tax=Pelagomonas calceolata TaxID=35677 RepID=A0A8J2STU3_9STRA|nr:unnamed protein product [Pelagomonas calceolata]